jgi:hypothetical protein
VGLTLGDLKALIIHRQAGIIIIQGFESSYNFHSTWAFYLELHIEIEMPKKNQNKVCLVLYGVHDQGGGTHTLFLPVYIFLRRYLYTFDILWFVTVVLRPFTLMSSIFFIVVVDFLGYV